MGSHSGASGSPSVMDATVSAMSANIFLDRSGGARMIVARQQGECLAADAAHGAAGGNEVGLADAMARLFVRHDFVEEVSEILIGGLGTKKGADIMLLDTEETGADFAIGSEAQPVAVAAKGL